MARRVMAEQHIHLAHRRPGYIGIICTDLSLPDAIAFAAQRTKQVARCPKLFCCTCTAGFRPSNVMNWPLALCCHAPVCCPVTSPWRQI